MASELFARLGHATTPTTWSSTPSASSPNERSDRRPEYQSGGARLDCARCQPSRAWPSSCRRTTKQNASDRRSTSCSATSIGAARRRATGRPAPPGFRTRSRSSSSTTGAPTRPRRSCRHDRRPTASGPDGASLGLLRVPHGGKGAAVRAGMLAATADLVVFADADMATPPDQLPLLVDGAGRPRRRARLADPARRLGHADEPAALPARPRLARSTRSPRRGRPVRSRTRSVASRASGTTRRTTCSGRR